LTDSAEANADLCEFLERVSSWNSAAWLAHRERYQTAYVTLPFLPPECQNAVILQATMGHATGVGFGGLPGNRAYTRSLSEFRQHTEDVARLWGQRLIQSRMLFLAGNDVLHKPLEEIVDLLSAIGQRFPISAKTRGDAAALADQQDKPRFEGVHAFLDNLARPRPDRDGWCRLAERGLVRISLGVESGDPDVRSRHQKSWDNDALRMTIAESKTARIGVSVLILVGVGGVEYGHQHVERTVRLIESLELAAGDFVFLLDEKEIGDAHSIAQEITRLDGQDWLDQQAKLKDGLAPLKKKGVKVLPYTLEKQWT
jgi:hypothetical protein